MDSDEPLGRLRVVTGPQYEPVTFAEARTWCVVDDDDTSQDAILWMLVGAMREYAEHLTGRAFVQRTLEYMLDEFPSVDIIEMPRPPLREVTYITYLDGDGVLQTLAGSPSAFQVDTDSEPGRVSPLYGEVWPTARGDLNSVRIRYVAGYVSMSAIPRNLKIWMQARIATLYENREQVLQGNVATIERDFADGLLDPLTVKINFA